MPRLKSPLASPVPPTPLLPPAPGEEPTVAEIAPLAAPLSSTQAPPPVPKPDRSIYDLTRDELNMLQDKYPDAFDPNSDLYKRILTPSQEI